VIEVMGRECGYLALMSSLASGAERVYLREEGIALRDLEADLSHLVAGFQQGKLGLMIRNERASALYTTEFISALFEEEGKDLTESDLFRLLIAESAGAGPRVARRLLPLLQMRGEAGGG
jgi:6-phosphofructokinase 1